MAITGTTNGQDAARRAALIRYAGGGGASAPAAPAQGGAPAPQARGGDISQNLLALAHQTVADTANLQANLSAWKAAIAFLGANLSPQDLQGQQGAGPQQAVSPAMGQAAAQAAPGAYARPPR